MQVLQSSAIKLQIDTSQYKFSIQPVDTRFAILNGARIDFCYWRDGSRYEFLEGGWYDPVVKVDSLQSQEQGEMDAVTFAFSANRHGLKAQFTFALTREHPLVLWKVLLENHGKEAIEVQRITMLDIETSLGGGIFYPRAKSPAELGFFSNGWQSWSPSRWYKGDRRMNFSRLEGLQKPMIYNPGTPQPRRKGLFSSDMFAVIGDQLARTGFLIGFLAQKKHFGSILADLNENNLKVWANGDGVRVNPGDRMETDWAVFTPVLLDHRAPLEAYYEAAARENHTRVAAESPSGWCSWYHYYTDVTAAAVEDNLRALLDQQEALPLQLVQIDDGYETSVGDWFSFKQTFPEGMQSLVDRITKEGLIPGLWQAPFIVDPRSKLFQEHPDWILRQANGRQVNAGFVWNTLTTALDLTIPDALAYAREVVGRAVHEWGFPYLKLDFLYAAALKGKYNDPTVTRAQVLRRGIEVIRDVVGNEVTLLGCGAPLGSVLGVVDAMRIGADVSGDWHPRFHGIGAFIKHEPAFPCARNAISNTVTRAGMHGLWWINDPDCLLVRPDTNLSIGEVQTLATAIALTGGSLLLSDDLPRLPAERLRIAEVLLPVLGERARVLDWFDEGYPSYLRLDLVNPAGEWHVLGKINWNDQPVNYTLKPSEFSLPDGEYLYREFWSGTMGKIDKSSGVLFKEIQPHGCLLLALRRVDDAVPAYGGSTLHFSQGSELSEWHYDGKELMLTLRLPRAAAGDVFLYLPNEVHTCLVNGIRVQAQKLDGRLYRLPVEVDGFCHININ